MSKKEKNRPADCPPSFVGKIINIIIEKVIPSHTEEGFIAWLKGRGVSVTKKTLVNKWMLEDDIDFAMSLRLMNAVKPDPVVWFDKRLADKLVKEDFSRQPDENEYIWFDIYAFYSCIYENHKYLKGETAKACSLDRGLMRKYLDGKINTLPDKRLWEMQLLARKEGLSLTTFYRHGRKFAVAEEANAHPNRNMRAVLGEINYNLQNYKTDSVDELKQYFQKLIELY